MVSEPIFVHWLNPHRGKWVVEDVSLGPQPEQYLHTTSGGVQDGPPLVLCPGYGAGTGFFFRCAEMRVASVHPATHGAVSGVAHVFTSCAGQLCTTLDGTIVGCTHPQPIAAPYRAHGHQQHAEEVHASSVSEQFLSTALAKCLNCIALACLLNLLTTAGT